MNKWEEEIWKDYDGSVEEVLKKVEKQYKRALADIDRNIMILQSDELTQSRIYRIEHQKALRQQVAAILDKLHSDEYTTISQFLTQCYTNGFVGAMYSLHKQSLPILMAIDPKQAVRAVLTDSMLSKPLYDSLGVDIKKLKRQISAEISRGIASGMSYNDIARNINWTTKTPMSRARTIVRTEAHRITQASHYDAAAKVKDKGVDIVLQWDASLDGDTRDTHRMLDGTIIEVGEYFESNGNKARFPGDFGDPAEDCNCRCVLTERARSALDEDELKTLQERAEFFGIDKTKNLEEFRKKYLKAVENLPKSGIIELPDIQIGRSLGAKAKNYDILDLATGEMYHFVEGSKIQNVQVFAGKGSSTAYRNAEKYASRYGGKAEDWQHCKGFGWIETEDGDMRVEVHWSQCEGIGKFDFFVKRWFE